MNNGEQRDVERRIETPRVLKATILLWADISYSEMEEIERFSSSAAIESTLCKILHIEKTQPRMGIIVDLYLYTYRFCNKTSFNLGQTATVLSIVKAIHQANVETPLDNLDECSQYFKELLLCHSVRRPPFSIELFSWEQMKHIFHYVINTYFRHFTLYKYVFSPQVRLDLSLSYPGMPVQPDECDTSQDTEEQNAESGKEDVLHENGQDTEKDDGQAQASLREELKARIEKEVKGELMWMTKQLEEKMKDSTDLLNTKLTSLEKRLGHKK